MLPVHTARPSPRSIALIAAVILSVTNCTSKTPMTSAELTDFATRYAAAWSSQDPAKLGSFYGENGSLVVNGTPHVGRAAVITTAKGFMTAFPDMLVKLERVTQEGGHAKFHWLWTGTNGGPGGTGKSVRITGYEDWTFGPDGLIAKSDGHYDEAEYQRQLKVGAPAGR
jgi:hypothetical protein